MIKRKVEKTIMFFLMGITLLSAGCNTEAQTSPLLATELIYRDDSPTRDISFKLDSSLADYPEIARSIRNAKIKEMQGIECIVDTTCIYNSDIQMKYGGERLISLIDITTEFYGGNHPLNTARDMTFDVQTGQKLHVNDLFSSWPAAKELLQRKWCDAVSDRSLCPPIEEQALVLTGGIGGIKSVFVQTSEYAFGSYVEGPGKAYLSITPEIIALAKPEYQPYFILEDPCC